MISEPVACKILAIKANQDWLQLRLLVKGQEIYKSMPWKPEPYKAFLSHFFGADAVQSGDYDLLDLIGKTFKAYLTNNCNRIFLDLDTVQGNK